MPASTTRSHTCTFRTGLQHVHCLYLSAPPQIVVHLMDTVMNVAVSDTVCVVDLCVLFYLLRSIGFSR